MKQKKDEIRVGGRRYLFAGMAAQKYGYCVSALHHLQRKRAIPAVFQGNRKYICESALRQFLTERPPSRVQQVAAWLKANPRAKWQNGYELAALMAKDGIHIIPHAVARLLRQLGKARGRSPILQRAMQWMEADPARRFWSGKARRVGLEAALNYPITMGTVRRLQQRYDQKHGDPFANFPAADWASVNEVKERCHTRRNTVFYWIEHGYIHAEKHLETFFIERASLKAFLTKRANHITKTERVRAYLREQPGKSPTAVARRFECDDALVSRIQKALEHEKDGR